MNTKENVHSVNWRKGKFVINNNQELVIKKKTPERDLTAEGDHTLVIELDKVLLAQDETENAMILIDGGSIKYGVESSGVASYLSPGSYVISCIDTAKSLVDVANVSKVEENVGQVTELRSENEPTNRLYANDSQISMPSTSRANSGVKNGVKPRSREEIVKKVEVSELIRPPLGKRRCCFSDSEESDCSEVEWDNLHRDYATMNDLVNDLLLKELIDEEFRVLILRGISEMQVDILKELKNPKQSKHSYELLTFAFLLFYKQRRAYNYLEKAFPIQWPKTSELRAWRKLVNKKKKKLRSCQQPAVST